MACCCRVPSHQPDHTPTPRSSRRCARSCDWRRRGVDDARTCRSPHGGMTGFIDEGVAHDLGVAGEAPALRFIDGFEKTVTRISHPVE